MFCNGADASDTTALSNGPISREVTHGPFFYERIICAIRFISLHNRKLSSKFRYPASSILDSLIRNCSCSTTYTVEGEPFDSYIAYQERPISPQGTVHSAFTHRERFLCPVLPSRRHSQASRMCSSSSENCSDSEDEDSWDDYVDPPTQTNHEGGGSIISDLAKREPNKQKGVNVEKKPPKPKKERIQRSGWVNLNLTKNYGLASGWGLREGIRELMQNLYFHIHKFNSNNSADNVHGHPDGSERLVDWILESTENDTVLTYIAYNRGLTPKPRAGLHQRKNCLGYIVHRKKEGRFVLVNKKTALFRHIWSMGETSKGDREHHIGGHGTFTYRNFSS